MKTAEEWAKDEFGFRYIDDIEPETRTAFGTTKLLKQIEAIQSDAKHDGRLEGLREAAEIACASQKYYTREASIQCLQIHDAILARVKELEVGK